MKKGFLFGLGLLLSGIAFAATVVVDIPTKITGDGLLAEEFNQIISVLQGVQNVGGNIGIGKTPNANVKLDVEGGIKLVPLLSGGTCDNTKEGVIYVSTGNHIYGCTGTEWKQLDNGSACVPDCTGKECGGDGCSGTCGTCGGGESCVSGMCIACTPDCSCAVNVCVGSTCDDECSGTCSGTKTDGICVSCTDETWVPGTESECQGVQFTQTSNCGTERTATGTKTTEECCSDTTWDPPTDTFCEDVIFTQTSDCGNTRQATGTGSCAGCTDITWTPGTSTVCEGIDFIQMSNCGNERSATGTKTGCCDANLWVPSTSSVCSDVTFTQTNDCEDMRSVQGTMDCSCVSTWTPLTSTVCLGDDFTQYDGCGDSRRATGTSAVACNTTYSNYSWSTGAWGGCTLPNPLTQTCSGTQTRTVVCWDNTEDVAVGDSSCLSTTKPSATQSCTAAEGTSCGTEAGTGAPMTCDSFGDCTSGWEDSTCTESCRAGETTYTYQTCASLPDSEWNNYPVGTACTTSSGSAGKCDGNGNCNPTGCGANGVACNDGNACTINDVCSNDVCVGSPKCTTTGYSCNSTTGTCDCTGGYMWGWIDNWGSCLLVGTDNCQGTPFGGGYFKKRYMVCTCNGGAVNNTVSNSYCIQSTGEDKSAVCEPRACTACDNSDADPTNDYKWSYLDMWGSCEDGSQEQCKHCNCQGEIVENSYCDGDQSNTCYTRTCTDGGGTDDGCFVEGTKILLGDGTSVDIESVKVGDTLLSSDGTENTVLKKMIIEFTGKIYAFNGGDYFVTDTHPFLTTEGWKSLRPEQSMKESPELEIGLLERGDTLLTKEGEVVLQSIESREMSVPVYTFTLSGARDFYANGYNVHNTTTTGGKASGVSTGGD